MIPLLTADEMRAAERQAIEDWGIPSLVLQEHAALGALALLPPGEPLHVLAGPGNNGGDAVALARLARLQGRAVQVWAPNIWAEWRGDAAIQVRLWKGLGGTVQTAADPVELMKSWRGWVVDGLFGLGTTRPLEGRTAAPARARDRRGARPARRAGPPTRRPPARRDRRATPRAPRPAPSRRRCRRTRWNADVRQPPTVRPWPGCAR